MNAFTEGASAVMLGLLQQLPLWIAHVIDRASLDRSVTD
jgi:hypothetical protein